MKRLLLGIGLLLCVRAVHGNDQTPLLPPVVWEIAEGVQSPESVYLDRASGFLFVSNIGAGGATAKDGDGYVSKLTPDGKMLEPKWVVGLNAPKGLRSQGGTLWVADIDRLVGINIAEGAVRHVVEVPGARFLNDVAADEHGAVFVSDMLANRIYRYKDRQLSVSADGEELESPNGLLVHGNRLVVAAWGSGIQDDFGTKTPGRLFSLQSNGKGKELITPNPAGNFDGVEPFGNDSYLVSDWYAGKVYLIHPDGSMQLVLQLPQGTADLAYLSQRRLLIVPQMVENKVTAFEFPAARE